MRSAGSRSVSGRLLTILAPATFFEGYDALILGLGLPLIRKELDMTLAEAGRRYAQPVRHR